MKAYTFRITASRAAGGIQNDPPRRRNVTRERTTGYVEVVATDEVEAKAKALQKARITFRGFDVVRAFLI